MTWLEELLEYGKTTINLLIRHKIILIPQLALIVIKFVSFLALFALGVNIVKDFVERGMDPNFIFGYSFLPGVIIGGLAVGLIALVIKSYVDAGTSSLIFIALKGKDVTLVDFWAGGNYFFGRILRGNLLLILSGIILSPLLLIIYVIIGILTLGLGFIALPLLIAVFLGMWQVSLVCNDTDISTAIKNSYRFGKDYFWPFLFVNFIEGVSSGFTSFGGGSNKESQLNYSVNFKELDRIPSYFWEEGLSWLIGLGSAVFGLLFIITSLIKLVLNIFFKGYYFVLYLNKRAQL